MNKRAQLLEQLQFVQLKCTPRVAKAIGNQTTSTKCVLEGFLSTWADTDSVICRTKYNNDVISTYALTHVPLAHLEFHRRTNPRVSYKLKMSDMMNPL
ncbi:unnamed protein product [Boreogadus saida]